MAMKTENKMNNTKEENFSKKTQLFNEGAKEINDMKNAVELARGNEELKQGNMVKAEDMWGLLRSLKFKCGTSPARFSLIQRTRDYGFKDSRLLKFLRDFNVVRLVANGNNKTPPKYSWNIEIDRPFDDIASATEQGWNDYKYNLSNLAKKQGKRAIKLLQPVYFEGQFVEDKRSDSVVNDMSNSVEEMNEDELKVVAKRLVNDYAELRKSIEGNKESKTKRFDYMINHFEGIHRGLNRVEKTASSSLARASSLYTYANKLEKNLITERIVVETRFFFGLIKIKSTIKVAK